MSQLQPAYLILGTDPTRIELVTRRLKAHFTESGINNHAAISGQASALVAEFQMLGLFSEKRLEIVNGVQDWKKEDIDAIIAYLKAPSPDVVLMLIADKLAGNSRLKKAFEKAQIIECPGPDRPDTLRSWAEALFVANEATVSRDSVRLLINLCCGIDPNDARAVKELDSNDLSRIRTDIERIATYAGEDPITSEMVEALATRNSEEKIWVIGDAWASGNRSKLMQMVQQLLDQREHPVRLAGALGRHLKQVNDGYHLLQKLPPTQATDALVSSGVNQWAAKKVIQQAQRVSGPRIDAALSRIALLDTELKGAGTLGGRIGEDATAGLRIVLQRGLLEIV